VSLSINFTFCTIPDCDRLVQTAWSNLAYWCCVWNYQRDGLKQPSKIQLKSSKPTQKSISHPVKDVITFLLMATAELTQTIIFIW